MKKLIANVLLISLLTLAACSSSDDPKKASRVDTTLSVQLTAPLLWDGSRAATPSYQVVLFLFVNDEATGDYRYVRPTVNGTQTDAIVLEGFLPGESRQVTARLTLDDSRNYRLRAVAVPETSEGDPIINPFWPVHAAGWPRLADNTTIEQLELTHNPTSMALPELHGGDAVKANGSNVLTYSDFDAISLPLRHTTAKVEMTIHNIPLYATIATDDATYAHTDAAGWIFAAATTRPSVSVVKLSRIALVFSPLPTALPYPTSGPAERTIAESFSLTGIHSPEQMEALQTAERAYFPSDWNLTSYTTYTGVDLTSLPSNGETYTESVFLSANVAPYTLDSDPFTAYGRHNPGTLYLVGLACDAAANEYVAAIWRVERQSDAIFPIEADCLYRGVITSLPQQSVGLDVVRVEGGWQYNPTYEKNERP